MRPAGIWRPSGCRCCFGLGLEEDDVESREEGGLLSCLLMEVGAVALQKACVGMVGKSGETDAVLSEVVCEAMRLEAQEGSPETLEEVFRKSDEADRMASDMKLGGWGLL